MWSNTGRRCCSAGRKGKKHDPIGKHHAGKLARAYAYREENSRAFLVMAEDKPVGMGLYHDCAELDAYDFSQLLIVKRYQGRGYGREAVRLVLEEMCREAQFDKVVLCYIEGNEAARRLYESFGFAETGRDEDEIIMEARL